MTMRLAKFISDSGFTSRRDAEKLIISGAVTVNGVVVDTPVFFVNGDEKIIVAGREIKPKQETEIYIFNKPVNTMTTSHDPMGRKTIYDVLDKKYKNLKYVGRLDFKTTGLLLLTNDGNLARQMSLPSNNIKRTYIATVNKYNEKDLDKARRGVVVDGIKYRPMKIEKIDEHNLRITVTEGKKNEIRIVLKYIGSPVVALHRIKYDIFELGNLGAGKILKIEKKIIDQVLKKLLKS